MKLGPQWKSLITVSMLALASPSTAQVLGQALPTREEVERPGLRPPERPATRFSVEGEIERAPCPLADAAYQNITFTMRDATFNNLQGVSPEELRSTYAEYIGQTVPLATVCEIRDRAATLLRSRGYLAAVQVPPQEIENGIVRFDVLMAKVVRVQVRGDAGRSENAIAGFLSALTEMPVFNEREAERYLLLSRDLPGYDVRLTLRPAGTAPGEVIADVSVDYTPIEADFNVQNYGSPEVGRFGALVRAQFNGLTGLADRTSIGLFSTLDFEEQQVLQLSHDFGLGNEGLRIAGNFTYAWTQPGGADELDLKSRTLLANLEVSYPLKRSLTSSAYGAVGFDLVNQEVEILDTTTNRDKLRVAYLRLSADAIDPTSVRGIGGYSLSQPRWRVGASAELRQGLDIFDASEACATCTPVSRIGGDVTATVMRGTTFVEFRPVPDITLWVSPRAQYSNDAVLAFEEISGGNYTFGRGYDPGVISGYKGAGIQSEIRYGTDIPDSFDSFAFQPYVFFDAGRVWFDRDLFSGSDSLSSIGGGLRATYGNLARVDATLAVPLERAGLQTEKGDVRFLISLTTRLVPWTR